MRRCFSLCFRQHCGGAREKTTQLWVKTKSSLAKFEFLKLILWVLIFFRVPTDGWPMLVEQWKCNSSSGLVVYAHSNTPCRVSTEHRWSTSDFVSSRGFCCMYYYHFTSDNGKYSHTGKKNLHSFYVSGTWIFAMGVNKCFPLVRLILLMRHHTAATHTI